MGTVNLAGSAGFAMLARVIASLTEKGIHAYLVGGYVRDTLLKRKTADIDLSVMGPGLDTARELASELGGRFVLLDESNKIARVVLKENTEQWNLDLAALRGTIEEDLRERDFTINAIAAPCERALVETGVFALVDPWGGQSDLASRIVRVISPEAFRNDPARLLRAIRFAAELDFEIDPATVRLIEQNAPLLRNVAGERVRVELLAILTAARTHFWLNLMDKMGLLEVLFPELSQSRNVEQPKEHYWDVFTHSLETVKALERLLTPSDSRSKDVLLSAVPWMPELASHFEEAIDGGATRRALLKLAALLHDVAKPQTRTKEGERWRFLGHAKEGAATVESIMERLRFSRREINIVVAEVQYHLRPGQMRPDGLPTRRAIYRYFRDAGEVALDTLFLSLADHLATRGPQLNQQGWEEHARTVAYILQEREKTGKTVSPRKLIDGHDLMNVFHLKPGPELGQILEELREAQAAGEISTREEALAFVSQGYGLVQGE